MATGTQAGMAAGEAASAREMAAAAAATAAGATTAGAVAATTAAAAATQGAMAGGTLLVFLMGMVVRLALGSRGTARLA